ncbi:hypothetical protein RB213_009542 [Colletotrichum asianum]
MVLVGNAAVVQQVGGVKLGATEQRGLNDKWAARLIAEVIINVSGVRQQTLEGAARRQLANRSRAQAVRHWNAAFEVGAILRAQDRAAVRGWKWAALHDSRVCIRVVEAF